MFSSTIRDHSLVFLIVFGFESWTEVDFIISKFDVVLGFFGRETLTEDVKDLRIRSSSSILTVQRVAGHPNIMC